MTERPKFLICARSHEDIGLFIPVLEKAGCEAHVTCREDGYKSGSFDSSQHVGLVVLGDDVADADNETEYGREMDWVCAAVKSGRAVLGICHGAQLLAHLYCGKLHRWESSADRGLAKLRLTPDGEVDPVVSPARETQIAQWHSHTFTVPRVALDLAHSANVERPHSDAFRIGRNVYGLQFHPEPNVEMLQKVGIDEWDVRDYSVATAVEGTGRAILVAWVKVALQG
jgi:GMP synthase-like glutamine amidotransferase